MQGPKRPGQRAGVRVVIPYPVNQMRGQRGLLRVDRFFSTHGPKREKRLYRLRSSIERVNSRLKDNYAWRIIRSGVSGGLRFIRYYA